MRYGFNGNTILDAVVTKYLCIHKQTTVDTFREVVSVMVDRYRTRYHSLGSDIQKVLHSRDDKAIVYVVHHEHYSEIFTKESENFAREQEKKRRAELRERKANMIKRAEEDPTVLVVNRLNEEWLDKYYSVGLNDEVPEALKDIPNIHEIPAAHPPGVYILMQGDEVVYVGQSVNPSARLGKHTQDKVFDKAYLIPTNNLLETEAIYINKFKPKYNKRLY
jgi:predicted GIY-YIG superfamily endonuclease